MQVPIVYQKYMNKEVPPPKHQGPQMPQIPPMPQGPQSLYLKWDITNACGDKGFS